MDKFNARADATIGPHDKIANRAKKAIALLEEVMAAEIAPALVEVETDKSESGWPCWGGKQWAITSFKAEADGVRAKVTAMEDAISTALDIIENIYSAADTLDDGDRVSV